MNPRRHSFVARFLPILLLSSLAPSVAMAGPGLIAGGSFSLGSVQGSSGALAKRSITNLNFHGLLGWRLAGLLIGGFGQYAMIGQTTDPTTVGGTNVRGNGYKVGAGLSYMMGVVGIGGSFDFFGQHKMSNTTAAGESVTYGKVMGFTAMLSYLLMPQLSVDGIFGMHSYSKQTVGSVETDLGADKYKEMHYGVGASLHL